MSTQHSAQLFQQALTIIPGGVNNPARSFRSVSGDSPIFMKKGSGAYLWDEDDNRYIDYVMGWGPNILGHAQSEVVAALQQGVQAGFHFGAPTQVEYELCQFLTDTIPSIEMIRLVNSGTEATMAAIRTAKLFRGRRGIVKFLGCYHGWQGEMLTGSNYNTNLDHSDVHIAPFNDIAQTRSIVEKHHDSLAAIIVEPVAGNMGVIAPQRSFLQGLRELCTDYGLLLIFDEVMSGFRAAYPGAQTRYDVIPDITCLGKIIGGGLPIGAYGGRSEVMATVFPSGNMYQGGTYSGHPLSTRAGLATLSILETEQTYWKRLEEMATTLCREIGLLAHKADIATSAQVVGGMFTLYFCDEAPFNYESAQRCNLHNFTKFFHGMLAAGIYWPPSQFEAAHISLAHTEDDLEYTIQAASSIFSSWYREYGTPDC